jgi:hypothetical protein
VRAQDAATPANPPAVGTDTGTPPNTDSTTPPSTDTATDNTPATQPVEAPPESPETADSTSQGAASNLPNISVIGNVLGAERSHPDNDTTAPNKHLQMDETEVVIGSKIYPGVSGNVVLTVGGQHDDSVQVEEGYISTEQLFSYAPIGGRAGIVRLPFGKANPLHPHSLPYVDTASVINDLLGDFRGNGFEAVGFIPTHSNVFLQAQLGRWVSVGDEPEDVTGVFNNTPTLPANPADGFGGKPLTLGRLWGSTPVGANNELELGASGAFGQSDATATAPAQAVTLLGADATWRTYLPGENRILLQSELMQRKDIDATSYGYYVLGTYQPGHFYEFGTRYDWSEFATNDTLHESYLSLFATRYLSEMTFLRVQLKEGTNEEGQHVNEVLTQLVFGFGPHTHPLQ